MEPTVTENIKISSTQKSVYSNGKVKSVGEKEAHESESKTQY